MEGWGHNEIDREIEAIADQGMLTLAMVLEIERRGGVPDGTGVVSEMMHFYKVLRGMGVNPGPPTVLELDDVAIAAEHYSIPEEVKDRIFYRVFAFDQDVYFDRNGLYIGYGANESLPSWEGREQQSWPEH